MLRVVLWVPQHPVYLAHQLDHSLQVPLKHQGYQQYQGFRFDHLLLEHQWVLYFLGSHHFQQYPAAL